jgi:hypothetical protein
MTLPTLKKKKATTLISPSPTNFNLVQVKLSFEVSVSVYSLCPNQRLSWSNLPSFSNIFLFNLTSDFDGEENLTQKLENRVRVVLS